MRKAVTAFLALSMMCATIIALDTATAAARSPEQSEIMELAMSTPDTDTIPENYQVFNTFRRYWNAATLVFRAQRAGWANNSRNSGIANLAFDLANNFFGYQPNYALADSQHLLEPSNVDRIFDR